MTMKKNKKSWQRSVVTFQKIKFRLEAGSSATVEGLFPVLASEFTDGLSFLYYKQEPDKKVFTKKRSISIQAD